MLELTVNGTPHIVEDHLAGTSLLRVLRDELGLTGTKNACEQGECGSCTVRLDGELANACLLLTGQAAGREITTVEGLAAADGTLSPLQTAFVAAGAVQCGFCTPGMLMAATALLEQTPDPDEQDVREALAGNLCRCTGYAKIVDAVLLAAREPT